VTRTGTPAATAESADGDPLTVVGRRERSFEADELRERRRSELRCPVVCASGERTTARWRGVPLTELLAAADAPPGTTHLRLTAADGYRICVPVRDALDGIVADTRDGEPLVATAPYRRRFVAPGVDGERLVKGLVAVETFALDPTDDPDRLETVTLDGPGEG
jgi:DMSO/TMAO reductase YedYZ molybdopterin-dependent catalytic subunit